MASLPTGTVTFFFSDIAGSTRLLERLGSDYDLLLERHREIVRAAFAARGGVELGTQGDSFFAVFPDGAGAVRAAVDIQRGLAGPTWPRDAAPRVRIGLHAGEARIVDQDYVGLDVHRAARIMAAAHGGQIIVSEATRSLVGTVDGVRLRDLGEHRLRDLTGSEWLFQVEADGLATEFPPLRTLEAIPNNLPTQTSELVGRADELAEILRHLASPRLRLVTLTGPGGVGKTRLAVHAAADQLHRFGDGVFFVDLSAARDAEAALEAIVRAVGLTVSSGDDVLRSLADHLRSREVLLVLDNFEQVIEAADAIADLLRSCPRLRILVTSREALRVRDEQVVPVAPLSVPAGRILGGTDAILRSDAVRLFVARAQQVQPEFRVGDANARVVADICARLDGLPLAIEIAAARLRMFSAEELLDRLQSRLEVLRGGARDLPARQRTLRSTIDWSYELLEDDERRVFALMSVFSGARVEAVEEVCGRLDEMAGVDVVEQLTSLVEKGLVRSVRDRGRHRLSMLETIREYAAERLAAEPGLEITARPAHAEHYAALAAAARPRLLGPERQSTLDELAAELDNLEGAWRHFVEERDLRHLQELSDALWPLHEARGWYHGVVALANDLLATLSTTPTSPERADDELTLRLSLARGLLALRGYTEEVATLYRDALALPGAAQGSPSRLTVLRSLASYHLYRGEVDRTATIGREILALGEKEHDDGVMVEGHLILGPALAFMGHGAAGVEHLDRAISLFDPDRHGRARFRLGPRPGVAAGAIAALQYWLMGQPDTAASRAMAALDLAAGLGHPYSLAYATFHVGLLDLWDGRAEVARGRAREVIAIATEHDYQIWRALGLVLQGVTTAELGEAEAGLSLLQRGVALYEDLRTPPVFWAQVLGLHARACALAGRNAEAHRILDEALRLTAGETWDLAIHQIEKADLLSAEGDADGAAERLWAANTSAAAAGARMIQLKALTRLSRLAGTDRHAEGITALAELLATWTEGLDREDVTEARAAIGDAAARRA